MSMDHAHDASAGGNTSNESLQDLTGGGSTTLAQAIAAQDMSTTMAGQTAHMHDSAKAMEHTELLELFPDAASSNTAVAINGGSWFDAGTWAGGKVPTSGMDVYIPDGISVVYDNVSDARLDTVGVDGELHFAVDVNTKLMVDTLLTGASSVLTIGDVGNPVHANVSAEIIIHADSGDLSRADDPMLLSRGVVTHGAVRIEGKDKADFLKASEHPEKGDDFLVFDEMPMGWQVGDKLVVAGAHNEMNTMTQQIEVYQDEVVTIKSISQQSDGSFKVSLNQTLQYDHVPPSHQADVTLQIPVANYTRNVMIASETNDYLGDGHSVAIEDRGHVMFMHNDDVSVKNAEFFELGRTDKSKLISSAVDKLKENLANGEIRDNFVDDVKDFLATEAADSANNEAGRYALHFHRTGVNDLDNPAIAEGNAVYGSPGWGLVHHDANLNVISNAVFGTVGSGMVAEAGSEVGVWSDNIVIQTTGEVITFNAESSQDPFHPDYVSDTLNDFFRQGEAYAMKSRLLEITDNVATSANGTGFSFWPHGDKDGSTHLNSDVGAYEAVQGYDPFYGQDDVKAAVIPTRDFFGNEVIGSRHALNTSSNKIDHRHDMDVVIEDLLAWNVDQAIMSFYQMNYVIKDSVFIKGEGNIDYFRGFGNTNTPNGEATHIHDPVDFKLVNNYFEGWDVITVEPMEVIVGNTVVGSTLTKQTGPDGIFREGYTADNDTISFLDNSSDWMDSLPNPVGYLDAKVNVSKSDLVMTESFDRFSIFVEKTDTLGSRTLELGSSLKKEFRGADQTDWWGENASNKGYYLDGGEIYLLVDAVVGDRVTGTIGVTEVAIKLAFLNGDASGLPSGAVNNGPLPSHLDGNGVGDFKIVDLRKVGETGNLLREYEDHGSGEQSGHDDMPMDPSPEPPAPDPEPPVVDPEPPVVDPEPPVVDPEPPVVDPEPPVADPEPPVEEPTGPVPDKDGFIIEKTSATLQGESLAVEAMALSGDFSIMGCVIFAEDANIDQYDAIVGHGSYLDGNDINFYDGRLRLYCSDAPERDVVVAQTVAKAGEVAHYAITRENGVTKLYINSVLEDVSTSNWTTDFIISEIGGGVQNGGLDGAIEDLVVLNRALSSTEVTESTPVELRPVAPVAEDDAATVVAGDRVVIDVLVNDKDFNEDELSIESVGAASNGTTGIEGGQVVYTANAGYSGPDSFTYVVGDGNGGTDTATVTVTVEPPVVVEPEPPVVDPEPPVVDPEPEPEPPVVDPEPEPPVADPEPPVADPEPPVADPEPPVVDPEPPVVDPEPEPEDEDTSHLGGEYIVADMVELDGGQHSAVKVTHSTDYEMGSATLSYTFNADTVFGIRGIVTKDTDGQLDGDAHFSSFIKLGTLHVRFEFEGETLEFKHAGIEANKDYDVAVEFTDSGVAVMINGEVIGSDADFELTFADLTEDWLIGAYSGEGDRSTYQRIFDGTISDVVISSNDGPSEPAQTPSDPVEDDVPSVTHVFKQDGTVELDGSRWNVVNLEHTESMAVSNGAISLQFEADTVNGIRGLISKDAKGLDNTGDEMSVYIKSGVLWAVFENDVDQFVIRHDGIEAHTLYDLEFQFDENGVSLALDGEVIGQSSDIDFSFVDNAEYLQIGALGRRSEAGDDYVHSIFDGTIGDISFTTDLG